jgi:hypothetical protein
MKDGLPGDREGTALYGEGKQSMPFKTSTRGAQSARANWIAEAVEPALIGTKRTGAR